MAKAAGHPKPALIEAFALGRLGTADVERIESHLADCQACGRRLLDVPMDHLVRLLRRPTTRIASTPGGEGTSGPSKGARTS